MFLSPADPVRAPSQVGAELIQIAGVLKDTHDALLYFHVFATAFYFSQFYSETSYFYLVILSAQELHIAIGQHSAQVPCPVHHCVWHPLNGSG